MNKELFEIDIKNHRNIIINFHIDEELRDRAYDMMCKECLVRAKCLKKLNRKFVHKEKKVNPYKIVRSESLSFLLVIQKPCSLAIEEMKNVDEVLLGGRLRGYPANVKYESNTINVF